ncbi:MAG: PilW family protein [Xanthomonadales bacterium]|nr:PilW family protein [Xanthomonadales bacterium]
MSQSMSNHRGLRSAGFSVVEVLVSLVLGLLIVGAALTVFLSNRQTYRVAEALARIQESSRASFEIMARDLRAGGLNPCEAGIPIYNVLSNAGTVWWSGPDGTAGDNFVLGFESATTLPGVATGSSVGQRVAGTDALQLISAQSRGVVVGDHNPRTSSRGALAAFTMALNTTSHGIVTNDIVLVCDFQQGAIFQARGVASGSANIRHAVSGNPGNSRNKLDNAASTIFYRYGCFQGLETVAGDACRDPDPSRVDPPRQWPALIAELSASRWYVANNSQGNSSLVRETLQNNAGTLSVVQVEVVRNVVAFQLQYLEDTYKDADSVINWSDVSAVRVNLTLQSDEAVADDGVTRAQRNFVHTLALRGRTE